MLLSENEFQNIVSYVKGKYGINLSQKRTLISGRLENYLLRNGYQSYGEYFQRVEQNPDGEEAANLINVLTTIHPTRKKMSGFGQQLLQQEKSHIPLRWCFAIFFKWIRDGIPRFWRPIFLQKY